MQRYNGKRSAIYYYLFDLLWLDGADLTSLPLIQRKELLRMLIRDSKVLRVSETYADGHQLFQEMQDKGMEGIIGKKPDSIYKPGLRTDTWIKVKLSKRQEFIIVGYTESDKSNTFRSLMFGEYLPTGGLEYVHHSGGGWSHAEGKELLKRLQALEIKKKPFTNEAETETKQHYVKPVMVAEFELSTLYTPSGHIRHLAPYKGLREDKDAKEVVREEMITPEPVYLNKDSGWQEVDKEQQNAEWLDFEMPHCTVPVHNLEQELWAGVLKGQLLIYYSRMSKWILPYIKDRPQSLNLKLLLQEKSYVSTVSTIFIKDMENRQPECASIFSDKRKGRKAIREGKREIIDYLIVNNEETLLYMIDLGCIDINPWASTMYQPNQPDFLYIDLDPSIPKRLKGAKRIAEEDKGFSKAIEIARVSKEVLDKHRLKSFIKTSGKTGLHIYIPCAGITTEQARSIASFLCDEIHGLLPDISTREVDTEKRGDKVYLDAGQNDYADTLAAAYCVRPYHQPLISTPLEWREVKSSLDRWAFTIDTIEKRVEKKGDLWKGIMDKKIAAANGKKLRTL